MKLQLTLEQSEIEFMKMAINQSDPFATVKEAKSRVYETTQRIDELKRRLELDKENLARLDDRDRIIKRLQEKLNHD